MRTIILYGHQCTAQVVYTQVDAMLRERQVRDIVLVQTVDIDTPTAHALRDAGGELWYCGRALMGPTEDSTWHHADRYLLAPTWEALAGKTAQALNEFLGKRRVAA
jgi:hypothetical protein